MSQFRAGNIILAMAIALGVTITFIMNSLASFGICLGALYIALIFRYPIIHYYFLILASVNFFGYIDPQSFFRIPGVFKFNDLMLGLFFVMVIVKYAHRRMSHVRIDLSGYDRKLVKVIMVFLFLTVLQIFITSFRFSLPLISCIKVGRDYLYVIVALFALILLTESHHKKRLIIFIFVIAYIQSFLGFLQSVFPSLPIFGFTKVIAMEVGRDVVTRVYLPAGVYVAFSFALAFWLFFYKDKNFSRKFLITTIIVTGLLIVLSFNRTLWIMMFLIIFLPLIVMRNPKALKYLAMFVVAIFMISCFLVIINFDGLHIFREHAESIFTDVMEFRGNFAVRFEENEKRIELIGEYPFLGPGFVHADYAASLFNFSQPPPGYRNTSAIHRSELLQTNDSGTITWLVSYGIIGVLWVLWMLFTVLFLTKRKVALQGENIGIIVAITIHIWTTWLTSLTTTGFTFNRGNIFFAVLIYLLLAYTKEEEIIDEEIIENEDE